MLGKPLLSYRLLLRLLHRWSTLAATRFRTRPTPNVLLVGYLGQFDVVPGRDPPPGRRTPSGRLA